MSRLVGHSGGQRNAPGLLQDDLSQDDLLQDDRGRMIRRILVTLGGLALIALVTWLGVRGIGAEIWRAAWTIPFCLALHAGQLFLSSVAWRDLCGGTPPGHATWWRIRWVRESVNSMLPVAQIGGSLAGIRLLAARGTGQARAAAGTVLDLTTEAGTQALFTLTGIVLLAEASPDRRLMPWLLGGTAMLCAGILGFVAAQRLGLLRLIEAGATRLSRHLPSLDLHGMQAMFTERGRDAGSLARACALHLIAWLLGVGETALVLAAMGHLPSAVAALCIESLGMAARSVGFAIPGALGVQEAGFVLVSGLFGVPADAALALSMVKRARELLVGATGLVAWQGSEGLLPWRALFARPGSR